MRKELYTSPEVEIIEFDTKDVITTSDIVPGTAGAQYSDEEEQWWTPNF